MGQNTLDTDSFGGTAGTALPAYAAKWHTTASVNDVVISTPNGGISGLFAAAYNNAATFTNDHFAQVTIRTAPDAKAGVMVRVATGASFDAYWLGVDPADNGDTLYRLKLIQGASFTAAFAVSVRSWTTGDTLNLEVVGSTLNCYINGTLDVDLSGVTDTTLTTGQPGVFIDNSSTAPKIMDTWVAGSVGSAVTTAQMIPAFIQGTVSASYGSCYV